MIHDIVAKQFPGEGRTVESIPRFAQRRRHMRFVRGVGIAGQRLIKGQFLVDAMEPAGKHRGQGQIRIDVAAGQAVLHPCAGTGPDESHGAGPVVVAPGDGSRRKRSSREALVGVDVWRIQQSEVVHRREYACDELVVGRTLAAPTFTLRSIPKNDLAVGPAQRQVNVTGIAFTFIVFGHERERLFVLGGNLLGGSLVDAVVVCRHERFVIDEADLVLAEIAFAFGAFDVHAGREHVIADVAE